VKEGKYCGCISYSCYENGIRKPVEVVLRSGEGGVRENVGGVNLTKTYYKHICKC
jgi:hypothetical protein